MSTKDMNKVAREYMEKGLKVIPLKENSKKASTKWSKDADYWTSCETYWENPHKGNIAISTEMSDLIVIDVDNKDGKNGEEHFKEYCDSHNINLEDAFVVDTPNDGKHYYYQANGNLVKSRVNIIEGVDVRAIGGYVVAPPSIIDGVSYVCEGKQDWTKIPTITKELLTLCNLKKTRKKTQEKMQEKTHEVDTNEGLIPIGQRHDALVSYIGTLLASGEDKKSIRNKVVKYNATQMEQELDIEEVMEQVDDCFKRYGEELKIDFQSLKEPFLFIMEEDDKMEALEEMDLEVMKIMENAKLQVEHYDSSIHVCVIGTKHYMEKMKDKLGKLGVESTQIMNRVFIETNNYKPFTHKAKFCAKVNKYKYILQVSHDIYEFEDLVLYDDGNAYYVESNNKSKKISNFIMNPTKDVSIVDDNECVIENTYQMEFIMENGKTKTKSVSPSVFSSVRKFKEFIRSDTLELGFIGNEIEMEAIIRLIMDEKDIEKIVGIRHGGLQYYEGQWLYVDNKNAMDYQGEHIDSLINVFEQSGCIQSNIQEKQPIEEKDMEELLKHIFDVNTRINTIAMMGWVMATFFKARLNALEYKLPHLVICGEAGSGKSSIVEQMIQPLFSIQSNPISCAKVTPFALQMGSSSNNTIPLILEEYKPNRLTTRRLNDISGMMRDIYDGHTTRKGTIQLKVNEYKYICPLVVVGESGFDEKAIKDRSLEILFARHNCTPNMTTNFEWLCKNKGLLELLGRSALNLALEMEDVDIENMMEHRRTYYEANTNFENRSKLALGVVHFGMDILKLICERLNLSLETITNIHDTDIVNSLVELMNRASSNGDGMVETEIDKVITSFDSMAKRAILIEDMHYVINGQNNELIIYLKEVYPIFTKYYKDYNLANEMDLLTKNQFMKQLKETEYFKTYDKRIMKKSVVSRGNVPMVKCVVLYLDKVHAKLDLDIF